MRTPARFHRSTLLRAASVISVAVAMTGCGSSELHDRYTAERMLWGARREAQRLNLGQQVTQPADVDRARNAYDAIVKRFPPETWASRQGADATLVRQIIGEALFSEAELLASSQREAEAHQSLAAIQRWFPADDLAVRAAYLEAAILGSEKKPGEAAVIIAALPRTHSPFQEDGRSANPGVIGALLYAASWYAEAGDTTAMLRTIDEASAYYQGLIRDHPGTGGALFARSTLFNIQQTMGRWPEAVANLNAMAADSIFRASDPTGRAGALIGMRAAMIHAGPLRDPGTALHQITAIETAGFPEDLTPAFRIAQARILADDGQAPAALDTLNSVLRVNASDMEICARAYYTRGSIYEGLGDWEHALAEYRTLVNKYPKSRLGLQTPFEIVTRYAARGERERGTAELSHAISDYRRVIELDPRSREAVAARGFMAQAYEVGGRWSEAADAYGDIAAAARGTPAGAEALLREAGIYAQVLAKPDEAEKRLREIISSYPGTGVAELAQSKLALLGRGSSPAPPAPPTSASTPGGP